MIRHKWDSELQCKHCRLHRQFDWSRSRWGYSMEVNGPYLRARPQCLPQTTFHQSLSSYIRKELHR